MALYTKHTLNLSSVLDDYYARYHYAFLHAKGECATNQLLHILKATDTDVILELGCGSGATLIKLASECRPEQFHAVDTSLVMVNQARQRVKLCGLAKQVSIQHVKDQKLPFPDGKFTKIYVESALGIQQNDGLVKTLQELYRVMATNGKMVFNETIWTRNISIQEIKEFNAFCLKHYGIIQANAQYPYVDNWKKLLTTIGFKLVRVHEIKGMKRRRSAREIVSGLYTFYGKISKKLSKRNNRMEKTTTNTTHLLQRKDIMKGLIFELTK